MVAHELGHQKNNDLPRGLLWLALVAPAGTFLAQRLAERFGRRFGMEDPNVKPGPVVIPAVALAVTLVSLGFGSVSNVLSRQVEARADAFALDLTRDPASFVQFERRIALRNIADTDPPQAPPPAVRHPPDDRGANRLRRGVGEARVGCRARGPT